MSNATYEVPDGMNAGKIGLNFQDSGLKKATNPVTKLVELVFYGLIVCCLIALVVVINNQQDSSTNNDDKLDKLATELSQVKSKLDVTMSMLDVTTTELTELKLTVVDKTINGTGSSNDSSTNTDDKLEQLATELAQVKSMLDVTTAELARLKLTVVDKTINVTGSSNAGVVNGAIYTRWGRTVCPSNTTAIYAGIAAGSHYTQTGGTTTRICLPKDPLWGNVYGGVNGSPLYGAEYQVAAARSNEIFGKELEQQDVPCIVCEATGRVSNMLVPARNVCYPGWHLEYAGYLMMEHTDHKRTELICMDGDPEMVAGESGNDNGALFYLVEARGQIPNPPYDPDNELTCAVCTK